MTVEFGTSYASQYDALYGDKDYPAECDSIETLIRRHAVGRVHDLLDLGCGTGTHAYLFAERGYAVTGVDRSAAMLDRARAKAAKHDTSRIPTFIEGDVRAIRTGKTYDAVLMLFAVLGYQTSNDDVAAALRTARAHLRPGGVFICDVWFGPAVLTIGPSPRTKVMETDGVTLTRTATAQLDVMRHTCSVAYRSVRSRNGQTLDEAAETHLVRYFFPMELDAALAAQQLEMRSVNPLDDINATPGAGSWNVWVCARG